MVAARRVAVVGAGTIADWRTHPGRKADGMDQRGTPAAGRVRRTAIDSWLQPPVLPPGAGSEGRSAAPIATVGAIDAARGS